MHRMSKRSRTGGWLLGAGLWAAGTIVACNTDSVTDESDDGSGGNVGTDDGPASGSGSSASEGGSDGSNDAGGDLGGSTAGDSGGSTGAGTGGTSSSGGSEGSGGSTAQTPGCTLAWSSGFENGFPGEFLDYSEGKYSANGETPAGSNSVWTILNAPSAEPILTGDHAYKGWVVAPQSDSHRAYPVLHTDLPTPLINTFMVYLDVDYDVVGDAWINFSGWGNQNDAGVGAWVLHTLSVLHRKLEFAQTEPFSGEYLGSTPAPDFPLRQWVRLTVYLLYEGTTGFVQVWQDGVPMLRGEVVGLANSPGTNMTRTHWGMYAAGTLSAGIQYNDDISLWTLDAPLTEFEAEPDCYLGL